MSRRVVDFLHFTDVHFGMRSEREHWPTVQHALFASLDALRAETGPWELVLFTGDFVGRGDKQSDFGSAREFLVALREKLEALGSKHPKLVAVPGNHDLSRPAIADPAATVMQHLWNEPLFDGRTVADEMFRPQASSEYNDVVDRAFANYSQWWADPGMDVLEPTTRGYLPGDFAATFEFNGLRLGLLGLNTAFLQLSDQAQEGDLAVDARQIQAACGGSVPTWAAAHDVCLLLSHHPPSWLRGEARETMMEDVLQLLGSPIALQLCGHLHEPAMRFTQLGGGVPTRLLQGIALFGREFVGPENRKRTHGYAACRIDLDAKEIRVWPFTAQRTPLLLVPDHKMTGSPQPSFSWTIGQGVTSGTAGAAALPKELEAVLARRLTVYRRSMRYRFEVLNVTARTMEVELALSYELVNAADEPQVYMARVPIERTTRYSEVRFGSPPIAVSPARHTKDDRLEFPVQLPVGERVPVSVKALVKYSVPDSEGLTTYLPSLDYELEVVYPPELMDSRKISLSADWLASQPGTRTVVAAGHDIYRATEPLLHNQGMRLSWRTRPGAGLGGRLSSG